ncbi:Dihydrolipoyllysine-residue succinyltransferase component of 2-oxoglutarate dehydrogenase complex [Pelagimonas phthalicica]|uniref:Dihydrolipoyllysine-residue succinyltransferase component of 2-oxoglutarate dehydrogenase complex n=1 Tax=Pelagimonas phthalicica TaxID=1037362 RepID=A0A238JIT3_9RHOB|nr:2-oxo acid dehydrogenase subunit E2 [Pelagimonas phthalicica]TDS89927.1 pyruvate dehydrogenase E2 component (dihydrolipoamide acetyltransferase) [Pelagimonas phthalicica]SMX30094.1 Dihydrolipoyllysine-residue succinyltransferase component of 2-oxoglutarate dehydrogenase complex [Pelagimonas phthalicica]
MTAQPITEAIVVPLRGARGMIADKMTASLQEAAQLTHHARADMTALLAAKARLKSEGTALSVEDLLMGAVIRTLKKHPDINGRVQGREVHLSETVDLGVAIALPGNLLAAPAIFGAESMSLAELNAARRDLVQRANTNKLTVPEMTGGTFTISNLGLSRVEQFTPIINTPQIAILGIGRSVETPVRDGDSLIWKPYAGLSLTFDHRAIDGAPAAAFLTDLCAEIEDFAP